MSVLRDTFNQGKVKLVKDAGADIKWLIIDAQAIPDMDVTGAQRFAELHREMLGQGIEVKIADAPRPFLEELAKVGLSEALGSQQFFVSVKKAVEAFEQRSPARPFPPLHSEL